MKQDLDTVFHKLLERYYASIEQGCKSRISQARSPEFVWEEIKQEVMGINGLLRKEKHRQNLLDAFGKRYKRGESIEKIIEGAKKEFKEELSTIAFDTSGEGVKAEPFTEPEETILNIFVPADRDMIRYIITSMAYAEISSKLPVFLEEIKSGKKSSTVKYAIKWTGKKDNRNEFVQLIYGLHEAGLLNNGKGEITKIVEALAEVFDLKLSDNWQSNLSKSIHNATSSYEPEIFDAIKTAFSGYCAKKRKEKKQNRMEL